MKKRLFGLTLGILFACGTLHSQTSMPVPFGSFEQWTSHPGYSLTVLGMPMSLYSDYSTPNGWDILTYPINETFSFVGNNITVNTSVPLAIVSQETGYVPNGSSAARLQTFMLNNIVTGLAYAVAAPQLDTMLTQTVFPSILATGTVNFDSLFPLVNTLVANTDSIEDMLVSLAYTDVNSLITGGISLAGFEPSRLTGSYKYHSADSGDNGAVILLGTHYNAVTHQRNVVGGGINYALTDVTNYTPFTVDYVSLHSFESTFPEQAPDSLIVLIVSSASENRQQGSYLCIDNLMLWHDSTGTVLPDTCAAITWFSATPGIHDAAINWSAGGIVGSYEMEYGVAGFTQGEGTSVYLTNNTYSLTNLDANTSYDVYLRTVCNDSIYGDWSSLQFTTLPDTCARVMNLEIHDMVYDGPSQYVLTWWGSFEPDHWEVAYFVAGTDLSQGTIVTTNESHFDIYELEETGVLAPNTTYLFGVRSVCENDVYGDWEFTGYLTPCAKVDSIVVWDDSVYVNSVNRLEGYRVTWNDTNNTRWYVSVGDPTHIIPDSWNPGEYVDEPMCHLHDLQPNMQYYVEVTPLCGEDNEGETEWVLFTTINVGIQQAEGLNLSVYPNPASGSCEVNLSSGEPAELKLFSYDGRLLQTIQSNGGSVRLKLPSKGLYLLQATTASGTTTCKIVSE